MAKYKAYIFDFDLTLADSSKAILECFRHTLGKFGYDTTDDEKIYATIGHTLQDSFDILTDTPNNPQRDEMRKVFVEKANEVMSANTFFYDNAIAILQALSNAGVKVAIVSTKMRYRIVETFEMQAHCHPYDLIIGLEDVSKAKPDPQGIEIAVEKFAVDKSEALYIGDSCIDAETAMNAGVDFAGVTTGPACEEELQKYPNVFVGDSLLSVFGNI